MSEETDTPTDITTLITALTKVWDQYHLQDDDLWESFRENFKGYTENDFKIPHNVQIRKLRELLRKQGVWVLKDPKVTISRSLFNTLQEETPTPWTEEEVTRCKTKEPFTSFHVLHLIETDFGRKPKWTVPSPIVSSASVHNRQQPAEQRQQAEMQSFQRQPFQYSPIPQRPLPQQTSRQNQSQQPEHSVNECSQQPLPHFPPNHQSPQQQFHHPLPNLSHPPLPSFQPSYEPRLPPFQSSMQPPSLQVNQANVSSGHGRKLANLAKMYTDEAKYSGEDDSFAFKLSIFHDVCTRADIPPEAKLKAFPIMLKGLALDYYYSNMSTHGSPSFDQICRSIQNYFEGAEYRRSILARWNGISLKSVMAKTENEGKPMEECLQLLIKDLRHLQHGLDSNLRSENFIHNKLINACQDIPACQYACFKPSENLAGLINDLQSSIVTFNKANQTEIFFADHRYH